MHCEEKCFIMFTFALVCFFIALGIHCFKCQSEKSWADCENNLERFDCNTGGKGDYVCYAERLPNGSYLKGCDSPQHCNPSLCNPKDTACGELYCCCEDFCNIGIPGQGEVISSAFSIHSAVAYFVVIVLLFLFLAMS